MSIIEKLYKLILPGILAISFTGCGYKEPQGRFTQEQIESFAVSDYSQLPNPSGGLVLAVNGQTISASDIVDAGLSATPQINSETTIDEYAKAVYPHLRRHLVDRITNILLYENAKKTFPESVFEDDGPLEKAVDAEVRKLLIAHENNYSKAQQELERNGYDWQSFREFQEKQILAQMYFAKQINRDISISRNEMVEFYEANKDQEFAQQPSIRFLLIHLTKEDDSDNLADKTQAIIDEINKGKDFEQCISEYSQGIRAKFGGEWKTTDPTSLIAPYDVLAEHINKLSVGEVSMPISNGRHTFILKLTEKVNDGYIPFVEVQTDIERKLRADKHNKQINNLLEEMFEQADIVGIDGFLNYCIQQSFLRAKRE